MEQRIVFEDKNVSYKTFLEDLATFLAPKIALLVSGSAFIPCIIQKKAVTAD